VTLHLCDITSMCHYTYVTLHLCDITHMWYYMWHYIYVTLHLCDITFMWHYTYVTLHLCDITPMWHYIYVTLHLCDITPMWYYIYVTLHLREITPMWQLFTRCLFKLTTQGRGNERCLPYFNRCYNYSTLQYCAKQSRDPQEKRERGRPPNTWLGSPPAEL
jgi:hypothetical protein